jgi:hypothetical protein
MLARIVLRILCGIFRGRPGLAFAVVLLIRHGRPCSNASRLERAKYTHRRPPSLNSALKADDIPKMLAFEAVIPPIRSPPAPRERSGEPDGPLKGGLSGPPQGPPGALAQLRALWQGSARLVRAFLADSRIQARCRSSVVEHSIGNGEVDSSILSGSTILRSKHRTVLPYPERPGSHERARVPMRSHGDL